MTEMQCVGEQPEFYVVNGWSTYNPGHQYTHSLASVERNEKSTLVLYLPPNDLYTAAVIPGNAAGNGTSSGTIQFCEQNINYYYIIYILYNYIIYILYNYIYILLYIYYITT